MLTVRLLGALLLTIAAAACAAGGPRATIREETRTIRTYPFGDPDPVPILARSRSAAIYPYFRFDGFSAEGRDQAWKVVRLENDYLIVDVLPDVGGKVLGAIEKSTGRDFIYWNDVLKFRDVAMRGPWTSGGIEFNFGLIGHTPATATPVDYALRENEDGSVSCFVGAMDLPGRTEWRVEIRLPAAAAYFETRSTWYNPTPLTQPYYQWMNAAVDAREDLQFFYPGQYYIGHGGDAHPWPVNENGIDLSQYRNHHFGGHKSLHVLGSASEFSGGYWHDLGFGFGHWARYDDMPGRKIWIWSLSRSGAIWEPLLTDANGQYVEVQSGRQFSQANASSGANTPFTQAAFAPYATDTWSEIWFPIKAIGGLVAATPDAALNVVRTGDRVRVALNALRPLASTLTVSLGDRRLATEPLRLAPMEVFDRVLDLPAGSRGLVVAVDEVPLWREDAAAAEEFARPVWAPVEKAAGSSRACQLAREQELLRVYDRAIELYAECIAQDPLRADAMTRLGELQYRRLAYAEAAQWAERALAIDTYDPAANFLLGLTLRQRGRLAAAREALGWAARSPAHRSAAFTQMAEILLAEGRFADAADYAGRALDANRANVPALAVQAMAARAQGRTADAEQARREMLRIDPLNHLARAEAWRAAPSGRTRDALTSAIRAELPHESYLELAATYARVGFDADAIEVLRLAPSHVVVDYWLAFLLRDRAPAESQAALDRATAASPHLVFPFRAETMPVLEWALSKRRDWQTMYYAALIHWSRGRLAEAAALLADCAGTPDVAAFYLARAELARRTGTEPALADYERAAALAPDDWRSSLALARAQAARADLRPAALETIGAAARKFSGHFVVGLEYARQLIDAGRHEEALAVLDGLVVLPYENASEGRVLHERAHLMLAGQRIRERRYEDALAHLAKSREWPERLGVGRPYTPDERLQDLLEAYAARRLGRDAAAPGADAVSRLRADLQRSGSWKLALLDLIRS
jgi:tetratricopeptide (TPR) repeat protein